MGILLVLVILWRADFSEVFQSLKTFDFKLLLTVCLLQLLTILLINLQWHKIALHMGEKLALRDLFYMNMMGTFVESITPSAKTGGEAAKVYLLKARMGLSTGKAAALVGIQKVISLIAFLFLNVVAMTWFFTTVTWEGGQIPAVFISFLFLAGFVVLLMVLMAYPSKLNTLIKKLPLLKRESKDKIMKVMVDLQENVKEALQQKKPFLYQIVLAFTIWLLFAYKAYLIASGLQIQLPFMGIAVVTYLTYMIGMLPLLPGGVGTFEGSMVFFLLPMGIPSHEGVALALILRFVTFWLAFFISAGYLGYQQLTKEQNTIEMASRKPV
ncbi:hypothetical protein SAMN05660297_00918 [Natronincola peptidivorans]|uniref:Phosphatidylglycerol lysyltransferase n=2 Tax=Natronincola peptidivorans TaxID=426128 RepID=A0A1I0AAD1_9FIRM|nr:hypothetical protein SAMN05660297_00918 [Natronincola peptidivorans]